MMKKSKNRHFYFLLKNMWEASPITTIINFTQYAINGASDSLILLLMGMFINTIYSYNGINKVQTQRNVLIYILLLSILIFTQMVFSKFSQVLRERQIFSVQQHLDREICNKLIDIPNDILDTKKFQDDFRIVNETNTQIYLFITYLAQIISFIIQLCISFVMISKLSIILIIPCVTAIVLSVYMVTRIQISYWSEYLSNTYLRRKMDYFLELFMGINTLSIIKAFHTEKAFFSKTIKVINASVDAANSVVIKQNNRYAKMQMCILLLPVTIAIIAGVAYYNGNIMVGDVIMYIGLGKTIHSSVIALGTGIQKLHDINESVKKLYDFLFTEQFDITRKTLTESIPTHITDIKIENLTFYYPKASIPALNNISLNIKSGDLIAIVGENGSGKSTFVKILLGLYKNYQGSIKINGIELNTLSAEAIVKLIAPCFQDFLKPKFLLREAIGLSNIHSLSNDAEIEKCLLEVNGDNILSTAQLDDQLGTEFYNGVNLSIGQWQKIAVARAYFGNKNITLLDEPMSAIDIYSERQFFDTMSQNLKSSDLCIFVSHRMLGMKKCDEIFVFDSGEVVEHGNHDQLMNKNGKYTELFCSQNILDEDVSEL